MLLAIDIGNTQTMVGVFRGSTLCRTFRVRSDRQRTSDEYRVLFDQLLQGASPLRAAIIASVVPPLTPTFVRLCQELALEPLQVGPGIKTGIVVRYENPREVGADRIVNAVAAHARCPDGVIVVDFGTATTFDVVTANGEYLGGAIAPGIETASDALFARASKLPRIDLAFPPSVLGKTTTHSMQSGILFGYASLVEGMVARLRAEVGPLPTLATGGLGGLMTEACPSLDAHLPMLTLEGLRLLAERNGTAP
jgi:type III pantothenate kinase